MVDRYAIPHNSSLAKENTMPNPFDRLTELPSHIPAAKWVETSEPSQDLEGRMVVVGKIADTTILAEATDTGAVADMFAFNHETGQWYLFVGEGKHFTNTMEL